jgi:hypothetical protein
MDVAVHSKHIQVIRCGIRPRSVERSMGLWGRAYIKYKCLLTK